ncbi:MAG: hypothetical protein CME70_22715 [Halobacteriovorax sp.]|nr:hypothetical protein [Halobacteriovorax sp.]
MRIVLSVLVLLFSEFAFANITVGTFGPPLGRVREEALKKESAFSTKPYVGIFYKYQTSSPWVFDFEFDYVFPQESYENIQSPKTQSKRFLWHVNGNYYTGGGLVYGIAGLSTVVTKVTGEGGSVDVSGSTFYLPKEPENSSYNMTINLGAGLDFMKTYFAEFKTHIWRPLSGDARAFSFSLALKFQFFGGSGI